MFPLFHGRKASTIKWATTAYNTPKKTLNTKILIDVAMSFPASELNLIFCYVPQFSLQLSW